MKGERVYISGPISKRPEEEYRAHFNFGRSVVHSMGGFPVCPVHDVDHSGSDGEWLGFMRRDLIAMLEDCTSVFALKGWRTSRGASIEIELAEKLGLTVYYEEELPI